LKLQNDISGVGHSSEAFGFLALATLGSANRWICGFAFGYAQIPTIVGTSHIPGTLSEIQESSVLGMKGFDGEGRAGIASRGALPS